MERAGAQGAEGRQVSTEISEGAWAADHKLRELLDSL